MPYEATISFWNKIKWVVRNRTKAAVGERCREDKPAKAVTLNQPEG